VGSSSRRPRADRRAARAACGARELPGGNVAAQQTDDSFTEEEIVGQHLDPSVRGRGHDAHTLGWTIWLLGSRARCQTALAAEASEILGGTVPRRVRDRRSLRLRRGGAARVDAHQERQHDGAIEPLKDTTICDTHIPAGTRLLLLLRHAALGERADAFEPERWLDQDNSDRSR